jgi:hypothetical protein
MSTGYVDGNTKTFTAGAAIAENLRVYLSSSKLAAAGATQIDIGTMTRASLADGDLIAVRLCNAAGTTKMVAAAAISADAIVYTAAAGKVNDEQATGASRVGIAITAATNDGDVIEVLRD